MTSLDVIKRRIGRLYAANPKVHVNVSLSHPKLELRDDPVTIKGGVPSRIPDRGILKRGAKMSHASIH